MGSKPWVQNDELKIVGIDYSRGLIYIIEKISGQESWDQNHGFKTMSPKP